MLEICILATSAALLWTVQDLPRPVAAMLQSRWLSFHRDHCTQDTWSVIKDGGLLKIHLPKLPARRESVLSTADTASVESGCMTTPRCAQILHVTADHVME